jgi:hypothetical protein
MSHPAATTRLLAGAIALLALGLLANAAVLLLRRGDAASPAVMLPPLQAQPFGGEAASPYYFLGRDTYFVTSSADGKNVYLWYYDFDPQRAKNAVFFVNKGTAD